MFKDCLNKPNHCAYGKDVTSCNPAKGLLIDLPNFILSCSPGIPQNVCGPRILAISYSLELRMSTTYGSELPESFFKKKTTNLLKEKN